MVTIYDIAKKTGYSVTTVSKVINNYQDVSEKTKKAIQLAMEETGYLPNSHARSLTTKKSWTIGVVFIESLGIGMKHPFFNAVIESFRKQVELLGYDLLFASRSISNQKKSYLDHFRYRGVDGVVIVCSTYDDEQVQELIENSIPSVVIDLNSKESSAVYSDNLDGSRQAVEYLYGLGHRAIAHIRGHQSTHAGEQRMLGYKHTLTNLGIPVREEYIENGRYFSRDGGYEAMEKLLALMNRPTAVYAAGDSMAIGAIEAIRNHGLHVPEDISVIGYDDIELSQYVHPPLTTIRQKTDLIGIESAKLLVKQINEKEKCIEHHIIPVELVERHSCSSI
ncbi:substrate-binding domain-containing protein [Pontibacillus yanchengensis]|uniref:Substrate-binding domain-containing protein n=2 Tax=Pontibacillus yanchengensis TaxID=462910 RepID=A0ACC7VC77_9BACI|nr:LacI family DNA-binding transcriptional regulator [Pontibacillus yanchengensis]MYL32009.1 substrate-binding domain-containing protein [Pontibacillus yanchengensis]MYL52586.1 substrate-binding domain-containing protein [Pontibacillus yanchengensis]